jgi:hypothetical protein
MEGIVIQLARPPPPPFDIDTMEPIEPPWQAIKEWIPDDEPDLDRFNRPRNPFFPRLWSSHELSQRPSSQKQIPSNLASM